MAAVGRNRKGEILQVRVCKLRGDNPLKGEARAARLACMMAEDFAEQEVCLEGDAQQLVKQVNEINASPDWLIEAEVMTIRAMLRLHPLWRFQWTPREGNYMAHHLAIWGHQFEGSVQVIIEDIPPDIAHCDDSVVRSRVVG